MERWKDIKGYEGLYQISDHGNVRSLDRVIDMGKYSRTFQGRPMKPFVNTTGYLAIHLSKNGEYTSFLVNRLVAIHFIENPNDLPEVNHKDHEKFNNHFSNLFWVTRKENMDEMFEFYGIKTKPVFCKDCNKEICKESERCKQCDMEQRKLNYNGKRPEKETLEKEIYEYSFLALGKKYGVSDNAVRIWCKHYDLPYRKKDLKK